MRFNHQSFDQFRENKKSATPTLIALSLEAWKKGVWPAALPDALRSRIEKASARLKEPPTEGARLHIAGLEKEEGDVWIALLPKEKEAFFILEFARDSLKACTAKWMTELSIVLVEEEHSETLADAFGSALAARVFEMPVFGRRAEKRQPYALKKINLVAFSERAFAAIQKGHVLGEGTNLARYLATLPPNFLDPALYGERIRKVCRREHRLVVRFYSNRELKRMGAGAFTAVDQGNPESAGGIYEITYAPKKAKNKRPLVLVGKGLCFDTGGYDVKINSSMMTMKGDMQGSAVALAGVVTASRLKLPLRMKAFLGVTENHLSPRAFTADEVVTALNGLTIEVVNTDAEGRMVLADTLALASKQDPECIIDFATLTGSAVRSLGTKYSAGFTNRMEWHAPIIEAGRKSGERIWTFPMDPTYHRPLESKVADTLQCLRGPGPDHIYAACFLSKFVKEGTPWVHIDLAASENEGGLAHVDSMFTGFGVRWMFEFIEGRFLSS